MNKRWVGWLILLLVGTSAGLLLWKQTRERRLLTHSDYVADVRGWYEAGSPQYQWLSNSSVFFLRSRKNAKNDDEFSAFRLDTATGSVAAYPDLQQPQYIPAGDRVSFKSLSPDGRWLYLWCQSSGTILHYFIPLSSNPAEHAFEISTLLDAEHLMWMPSSHVLLQVGVVTRKPDIQVHNSRAFFIFPDHPQRRNNLACAEDVIPRDYFYISQDRSLLTLNSMDDTGFFRVEKWAVGKTLVKQRERSFSINPAITYENRISPLGDRIAWIAEQSYTPPLMAWLHRYFPAVPERPASIQSVWICRLDGTDLHEIGHVPVQPDDYNSESGDYFGNLQWLPDGKRLSFVYRNALYVTPAD